LTNNDLKSLSLAIYRQPRKRHPTLPKCIIDVHEALSTMTVKTSKYEDMCLVSDVDSHIIIFSCTSNLRVLCTLVKEIFIDGTFKCCPKFFEQLYLSTFLASVSWLCFVFTDISHLDCSQPSFTRFQSAPPRYVATLTNYQFGK
jgi:hypothetical protein